MRAAVALTTCLTVAVPSLAHAAPDAGDSVAFTEPTPEQQELDAIKAKGKRLSNISYGFTAAGLGMVLGSLYWTDDSFAYTNVGIGLASAGLVLSTTAVVLAVAGLRRVRHPEKFVERHQVALAPTTVRRGPAVSLSFRF